MIDVKGLTKAFGDQIVVDRVTFEVGQGETLGLLGENGAGKTTTLRMLATLLQPTAGSALIGGADLGREPEAVRRQLGIVFEGGVYDRLTARENIAYFGKLHGMSGARLARQVDDVLALLGMEDFAERRAGKLSKGMRQKVVIGRALVHDPPILLMDEATAGLDVTATRFVLDFVQRAKSEGKTIIFSSHSMAEVERVCDRVAIIHRGRIVAMGTVAELTARSNAPSFEEAFVEMVGGNA